MPAARGHPCPATLRAHPCPPPAAIFAQPGQVLPKRCRNFLPGLERTCTECGWRGPGNKRTRDRSGDVVASGDSLAYTGAANAELIAAALIMLALGGTIVVRRERRA